MVVWKENLRKGPDALTRTIQVLAVIVWALAFCVLVLVAMARPRIGTMFDRFYDTSIITGPWKKDFFNSIVYLLMCMAGLSAIGLGMNSTRHRRKSDIYRKTFLVFGCASAAGIALYYALR